MKHAQFNSVVCVKFKCKYRAHKENSEFLSSSTQTIFMYGQLGLRRYTRIIHVLKSINIMIVNLPSRFVLFLIKVQFDFHRPA